VQALPLTGHTVIGQIVKHSVEAVTPHHDRLACIALRQEGAIDVETCIAMEIERLPGCDFQRGAAVHSDAAIDDERSSLCVDRRIMVNGQMAHHLSIPTVSVEMDLLFSSVT